jgi:transcriptional regulator with XRE-family HTH domain
MPKSAFSPAHQTLVDALIAARELAGMSQQELARRVGRTQSWVSAIETRSRRIDVLEFYAWARAIDDDPVALFARVVEGLPLEVEI